MTSAMTPRGDRGPAPYRPAPPEPSVRKVSVREAIAFVRRAISDDPATVLRLGLYGLVPIAGQSATVAFQGEVMKRLRAQSSTPVPRLVPGDFAQLSQAGGQRTLRILRWFLEGYAWFVVAHAVVAFVSIAVLLALLVVPVYSTLIFGLFGLLSLVQMALVPLGVVFFNAALTRVELAETSDDVFHRRALRQYCMRTAAPTLRATLLFGPVAMMVTLLGFLFGGIGALLVQAPLQLVVTHLRWQIYERDLALGGERLDALPPPAFPELP